MLEPVGDIEVLVDEQNDLAELENLRLGHDYTCGGCVFERWCRLTVCCLLVCGPIPRLIVSGPKCGDRVYDNDLKRRTWRHDEVSFTNLYRR